MVRVERRTRTQDNLGGIDETWVEQYKVWANVRPLSTGLRRSLGREQSDASHEVELREERSIRAEDRIVVDPQGPTYLVLGILRVPGARGATAACREVVP